MQVPPRWVEEPQDTMVVSGQAVVLVCAASGQPPPGISWGREGGQVGGQVTMRVEGQVVWGRLQLDRAHSSAAGRYTCTADNGVGVSLGRSVELAVRSPPLFLPAEETLEAEAGQGLELRCQVQEGDRPLHYTWERGGRPLLLSSRY